MTTKKKFVIGGLSLLGVGVVTIAVALPLALMNNKKNINVVKYNVTSTRSSRSNLQPSNIHFDPNKNDQAIGMLTEKFNNLTEDDLQKDFNRILTDFFECYEIKSNNNEFEIERVKVNSLEKNNGSMFANLTVIYEKENESTDADVKITQNKKFQIIPTYITTEDILNVTKLIKNATSQNSGIDIGDLKELLLGEDDADDMYDFKDLDDYGIFDQIKMLNKKYNNSIPQGGMMGYKVTLSDLKYDSNSSSKSVQRKPIDENTQFSIPSIALNTYAIPSTPIDFSFNYNSISNITKEAFIQCFTDDASNNKEDFFRKSFIINNNDFEQEKLISIALDYNNPANGLTLTIEYDGGNYNIEVLNSMFK